MVTASKTALLGSAMVVVLALSGCLSTHPACATDTLKLACKTMAETGKAEVIITLKSPEGDSAEAIAAFKATFDPGDVTFLTELRSVMVLTAETNRAGLAAIARHPHVEHVMSNETKQTNSDIESN